MPRKVLSKLRNADITTRSCQGKLFESCGIRISLRVHVKKSCLKAEKYAYYYVLMTKEWCFMRTPMSLRVHGKETWLKVAKYAYHYVLMPRKVFES